MIIPDVNLLLYAVNSDSPDHREARAWWKNLLSSNEEIGIHPVVAFAFVRLSTHRKVFSNPLSVDEAFAHLENWMEFSQVSWIDLTLEDLATAHHLLKAAGTGGNLVTDAQIAAAAIRLKSVVHTVDSDFGRFPKIKWINPLLKK